MFEKAGRLRSARIAKKKDMKNQGKMLSMGFGFVEYADKEGAANAVKTLQGVKLDGHVLELKMAKNQPAPTSRDQTVCWMTTVHEVKMRFGEVGGCPLVSMCSVR